MDEENLVCEGTIFKDAKNRHSRRDLAVFRGGKWIATAPGAEKGAEEELEMKKQIWKRKRFRSRTFCTCINIS